MLTFKGGPGNCLYNVLWAYSKLNPEVGYCQGMNYLTALLLIGTEFNEALSFTLLVKLMSEPGYELASLYEKSLTKLFQFSDRIY